jgi:spore germination cell wall hydrolase CwlJ-like protein
MNDSQMDGLNMLEEAGGEIDDGKAAIARIVKNRMALKYSSDGTVQGTVLWPDQFSWAYFGFVTRHTGTGTHDLSTQQYVRLNHTRTEAQALAEQLLARANPSALAHCIAVADSVAIGKYAGPLYDKLTDDAVLYVNPRILTKPPIWAIPSALVCSIGHHDFYRGQ